MPIERIDEKLCTGCRICAEACIMDVIRFDDAKKKAIVKYPFDCVACGMCVENCPVKAITMTRVRGRQVTRAW